MGGEAEGLITILFKHTGQSLWFPSLSASIAIPALMYPMGKRKKMRTTVERLTMMGEEIMGVSMASWPILDVLI